MRNPALHLVGIAASPGGGGLFGTRAEEELRQWLEQRLDALGIDPVAYSRFVLSFLRHPDSALTPPLDAASAGKCGGTNIAAATIANGRRTKAKSRSKLPLQSDKEQRRAVVQCLKSAADQKCGVESLVDELCAKLKDLEGIHSRDHQEELKTATDGEAKVPFETLTPRDRALRYYAAFPALQPVTTSKKFPHWKDRNFLNYSNYNTNNNSSNNNKNNNVNNNSSSSSSSKNNNNCSNNNINNKKNNHNSQNCNYRKINISKSTAKNKVRQKKNKLCIPAESNLEKEKDLEFNETMERKRDQELALDELQLAQLQAKFDESLEALWDTGSGISRGTDSIWAAPSLSILSGPSWPTDKLADTSFRAVTLEKNALESPLYQNLQHIDDSPLVTPWEVDIFNTEDRSHDSSNTKTSSQINMCWSDSATDNSWYWGDVVNVSLNRSPRKVGFFPVIPCKSPVIAEKESCLNLQKISCLPEPDEDLLTSARTHFRPIKEDGNWVDGTTFPVNNTVERVAYRRSDSGNLLYLPCGESPYMEYRESLNAPIDVAATISSNFTLKFRVRQCDKSIQTEPIRSPIKRRILSEQDRLHCLLNTNGKSHMNDSNEIEKDSFDLQHADWADQPVMLLRNERKRRHSSSFKAQPLSVLRPLTL